MPIACTICDHEAVIKHVSFTHNGKLYSHVPITVCINPTCIVSRGGVVTDNRRPTYPRNNAY